MNLLGIGKLRAGHTVEPQFCVRDLQVNFRSIWADAGNEVLTSLHDDSLSDFGSTCGHRESVALGRKE